MIMTYFRKLHFSSHGQTRSIVIYYRIVCTGLYSTLILFLFVLYEMTRKKYLSSSSLDNELIYAIKTFQIHVYLSMFEYQYIKIKIYQSKV